MNINDLMKATRINGRIVELKQKRTEFIKVVNKDDFNMAFEDEYNRVTVFNIHTIPEFKFGQRAIVELVGQQLDDEIERLEDILFNI